ncbi:MAG: DNA-binding response regulator [Actinobacteria bacterium HGW-Actinobacteria-1]|jgi:DNA-binding NarL/FixJ family response regulator|nr:MAG: DNA-binding response regulator [Actinobacteria bacterium HGW-Actinobacteria-1]
MSIRVLIADDQALVRAGFRVLLETAPDIEVIGEAENGEDAVTLAAELSPDVILMDIRMPKMDGLEATRRILQESHSASEGSTAGPRVLVLTTFDADTYVYEALRVGASGFLLKDTDTAQLIQAVRVVADGEALLAPSVTRRLIAEFASRPEVRRAHPKELDSLTERELEILTLVARGLCNQEIAETLFISPATAKTHVSRVMMKLQARDRAQLVVMAYEAGLVVPGPESN